MYVLSCFFRSSSYSEIVQTHVHNGTLIVPPPHNNQAERPVAVISFHSPLPPGKTLLAQFRERYDVPRKCCGRPCLGSNTVQPGFTRSPISA